MQYVYLVSDNILEKKTSHICAFKLEKCNNSSVNGHWDIYSIIFCPISDKKILNNKATDT